MEGIDGMGPASEASLTFCNVGMLHYRIETLNLDMLDVPFVHSSGLQSKVNRNIGGVCLRLLCWWNVGLHSHVRSSDDDVILTFSHRPND